MINNDLEHPDIRNDKQLVLCGYWQTFGVSLWWTRILTTPCTPGGEPSPSSSPSTADSASCPTLLSECTAHLAGMGFFFFPLVTFCNRSFFDLPVRNISSNQIESPWWSAPPAELKKEIERSKAATWLKHRSLKLPIVTKNTSWLERYHPENKNRFFSLFLKIEEWIHASNPICVSIIVFFKNRILCCSLFRKIQFSPLRSFIVSRRVTSLFYKGIDT